MLISQKVQLHNIFSRTEHNWFLQTGKTSLQEKALRGKSSCTNFQFKLKRHNYIIGSTREFPIENLAKSLRIFKGL